MKKFLFLLFALLICLLSFTSVFSEDPDFYFDKFSYRILPDETLEVTGCDKSDALISIPSSVDGHPVTSIAANSFSYHITISSVKIPETVESIGAYAFLGCYLDKIIIPGSLDSIGTNPLAHNSDVEIVVSPDNPIFAAFDNVLFNSKTKTLIAFNSNEPYYEIPQGTLSIGDEAFDWSLELISVDIPSSVTSIGNEAFSNCPNLSYVSVPESVTDIGINPFLDCIEPPYIDISSENQFFETIDDVLFNKQTKTLISYPRGLIQPDFTIPQDIVNIGDKAFYYCKNLTSITIPESVISIGEGAFTGCAENLELTVSKGSFAADFAEKNGIRYVYPDSSDWLNN